MTENAADIKTALHPHLSAIRMKEVLKVIYNSNLFHTANEERSKDEEGGKWAKKRVCCRMEMKEHHAAVEAIRTTVGMCSENQLRKISNFLTLL